jgi:hypothetical protein
VSATRLLVAALVLALLATTGCRRTTHPRSRVSGTVTLRGQPIADGQVRFQAIGGNKSFTANVRNGRYSYSSVHRIEAGDYQATIRYTSDSRTAGKRLDQTALQKCSLGIGTSHTVNFNLE